MVEEEVPDEEGQWQSHQAEEVGPAASDSDKAIGGSIPFHEISASLSPYAIC